MIHNLFFDKFYPKFERFVIFFLTLSLMLMILYASFIYIVTLVVALIDPGPIEAVKLLLDRSSTIEEPIAVLQRGLFQIFGGFLLILLGFELIGTVKAYAVESHVKVESIISIAIIATARHLITMDYHHTNPLMIFAMGFVIFSLVLGYVLLKFNQRKDRELQKSSEQAGL